jgi:hypothetical protein
MHWASMRTVNGPVVGVGAAGLDPQAAARRDITRRDTIGVRNE